VATGGRYEKAIASRRHQRIERFPPRSGFHPIGIHAFQPVAVADMFRRLKGQRRIVKLYITAAQVSDFIRCHRVMIHLQSREQDAWGDGVAAGIRHHDAA
jgi:hypothetical protein